jgi:hypothetical protein
MIKHALREPDLGNAPLRRCNARGDPR